MIEIDYPQFTQADVVAVTDATEKTLQNWTSRNVLRLTEQNPGTARRRLYSAGDIIKVRVMLDLTRLGIAAAFAARFAEEIVAARAREFESDYAGEDVDSYGVPSRTKFVVARIEPGAAEPRVRVIKSTAQLARTALAEGIAPEPQTYVHLDVDKLVVDMLRKLLPLVYEDVQEKEGGDER